MRCGELGHGLLRSGEAGLVSYGRSVEVCWCQVWQAGYGLFGLGLVGCCKAGYGRRGVVSRDKAWYGGYVKARSGAAGVVRQYGVCFVGVGCGRRGMASNGKFGSSLLWRVAVGFGRYGVLRHGV